MRNRLYSLIQSLLAIPVHALGLSKDRLSLKAALTRCRRRKLSIGTVIDIGASDGRWSLKARKFFPDSSFYLVEAQGAHEKALARLKTKKNWIDYIISAAGDRDGEVFFDASSLFGGIASHTPLENNCITVPIKTVDTLVKEKGLKPPFLLKLDTHGFEVPIFDGSQETMNQTELIIVETYNFKLTSDSLRFHEMCSYLEARGFRCIDLCEPMHRPRDGAFWQMDLFFAPADRDEFKSNTYE
jgi:FkbM family methyltransferase